MTPGATAAAAVASTTISTVSEMNRAHTNPTSNMTNSGDFSQSEAFSNLSSPDYNDEETLDILSARDMMMVSDPSDSDSTILASEPPQRRAKNAQEGSGQHRIVIQVKGPEGALKNGAGSPRQSRHAQAEFPQGGFNSQRMVDYNAYQVY